MYKPHCLLCLQKKLFNRPTGEYLYMGKPLLSALRSQEWNKLIRHAHVWLYTIHISSLWILMPPERPSVHTFFCLSLLPCGQYYCQLWDACHEIFTIPWVMFRLQGVLRLTILFPDQTWLRGVAVHFDPLLGLLTKSCLSTCQARSIYATFVLSAPLQHLPAPTLCYNSRMGRKKQYCR